MSKENKFFPKSAIRYRFSKKGSVNKYTKGAESKIPLFQQVDYTTIRLLLVVAADFQFNEEAIKSYVKSIRKWKERYPDLSDEEIAEMKHTNRKIPKRLINWGKLETRKKK